MSQISILTPWSSDFQDVFCRLISWKGKDLPVEGSVAITVGPVAAGSAALLGVWTSGIDIVFSSQGQSGNPLSGVECAACR